MYGVFPSSFKLQASSWKTLIGVVAHLAVPLGGYSSQQNLLVYWTFFALGAAKGLLERRKACERPPGG